MEHEMDTGIIMGYISVILGLCIGIMEKKMETTIYRGLYTV